MFRISFLIISLLTPFVLYSQDVYVKGYFTKDGEYIGPHYRSQRNNDFYDNFSTLGNFNPYTLKLGWKTEKNYLAYAKAFNPQLIVDDKALETAVLNNDVPKIDLYLRNLREDQRSLIKVLSLMFVDEYVQARELALKVKGSTKDKYIDDEVSNLLHTVNLVLAERELETANIDLKQLSLQNADFQQMKPLIGKLRSLKEIENQWLKYGLILLIYFHTDDINGLRLLGSEIEKTNYKFAGDQPKIIDYISFIEKKLLRDSLIKDDKIYISFELLSSYFAEYLQNNLQKKDTSKNEEFVRIFDEHGFKLKDGFFTRETGTTVPQKKYIDIVKTGIDQFDDSLRVYRLTLSTNDSLLNSSIYNSFKTKYKFINYGSESCIGLFVDRKIKERFGHPKSPINIEFYSGEDLHSENFYFIDFICIENNANVIFYNSKKSYAEN